MAEEITIDPKIQSIKELAWWLYILHGASLILALGMLSWIPLIVSYLKRDDAAGTFVYSHHNWQITTFWWYLGWCVLGFVLFITLFGIPIALLIWFGAWLWKAYRLIKGFLELNENKPICVQSPPVGQLR